MSASCWSELELLIEQWKALRFFDGNQIEADFGCLHEVLLRRRWDLFARLFRSVAAGLPGRGAAVGG